MRLKYAAAMILAAFPLMAQPSRPAFEKCKWEKFSDATVGLEAWVQRCDYGFRKISFLAKDRSLAISYSDGGGKPEKVIDVFDLKPGESPAAGLKRIVREKTPKAIASRCVVAPYAGPEKVPAGVKRFKFVPDKTYAKEVEKNADGGIPDPPCGEYGEDYDAVVYWEIHDGARRILWVRYGQDTPLFDEQTLRILK